MLKLSRFYFVWVAILFLQGQSLAERATHQGRTQTPAQHASRPVTESQLEDDWCHGQLNEDEKRKIKEELAAVYSKYQKSRDQKVLEGDLRRLFENNSGSQNRKKQAELAALMGQAVNDLAQATQFYDSLSAIEKGEPAPSGKTSEDWETLKKDYEELNKLGFKFDGEKGHWDLSGLAEKNIDLSAASPESKKSMERLLSPDIAEKFFDPNRREAFELGDSVIRPPQGGSSGELTVTTKEQHEKGVRETIDRLMTEKEDFLKASKEANSFMNSFRGSLLLVLGFERGHNGQSASEIQREGSYKAMQSLVQRLRDTYGVSPETLSDLNGVLQDALRQDSQGLAALDGKLTQAITALKTARNIAVVGGAVLATGGLAAPGVVASLLGAGTTGVMAGATTGAVGTAMAAAVGMSAIPAAINIGVDVTNGKKLSCSAMDQLVERGPQAVSSAMMAAAFAGGGGALGLGGAKLLAGASPYVGQAAAGLIGSGAQMGTGAFFLGMGANGVYQNGQAAYQLFQEANEAEARGDVATAKELRAEAIKLAAETGVNAIETAYGATQLARGAREAHQDYKRARAAEKVEGLEYQPTTKKPDQYEATESKVSSASDLDSMKPRSFAEVDADGVPVRTVTSDGLETVNVANKGDVIMSGPSGEKYVVKGAKFQKLYTKNADGTVMPEQSPRMVAQYEGPESTIKAPWGEEMVVKPGDYIVKEADGKFYRIAKKEYEATYQQPGITFNQAKAEKLVGPLTPEKTAAVERAHRVGEGQLGRDGKTPAAVDNYTGDQRQEKYRILAEAGFTKPQIKKLMDEGVVGKPKSRTKSPRGPVYTETATVYPTDPDAFAAARHMLGVPKGQRPVRTWEIVHPSSKKPRSATVIDHTGPTKPEGSVGVIREYYVDGEYRYIVQHTSDSAVDVPLGAGGHYHIAKPPPGQTRINPGDRYWNVGNQVSEHIAYRPRKNEATGTK